MWLPGSSLGAASVPLNVCQHRWGGGKKRLHCPGHHPLPFRRLQISRYLCICSTDSFLLIKLRNINVYPSGLACNSNFQENSVEWIPCCPMFMLCLQRAWHMPCHSVCGKCVCWVSTSLLQSWKKNEGDSWAENTAVWIGKTQTLIINL